MKKVHSQPILSNINYLEKSGWTYFNQLNGLKSRIEASLKKKSPPRTAISAPPYIPPTLPDCLPCGLQTCQTNSHNHIYNFVVRNLSISTSSWFWLLGLCLTDSNFVSYHYSSNPNLCGSPSFTLRSNLAPLPLLYRSH